MVVSGAVFVATNEESGCVLLSEEDRRPHAALRSGEDGIYILVRTVAVRFLPTIRRSAKVKAKRIPVQHNCR